VNPLARASNSLRAPAIAAAASCFVLLAASANPPPRPRSRATQAGYPKPAIISGHVYNAATGAPLAGAKVAMGPCYIGGVPWSYTVFTAADGGYSVDVRPFCYFLTASDPGYAPQDYGSAGNQWAHTVNPHPGDRITGVDFHLQPEAIFSGSVYTPDRQPAVHIRVCVGRPSYSPLRVLGASCDRWAWTDDQGHFRLDALSPGDEYVYVTFDMAGTTSMGPKPGWTYQDTYYPGTASIQKAKLVKALPAKSTNGLNFTLVALRTYTVTVVAQDQLPDQNDHFYTFALDPPAGDERDGTTNIHFFDRIPPGRYRITARAQKHGERTGTTPEGGHWGAPETQNVGGGWREIRVTDANVRVTIPVGKLAAIHVQAVLEPSRVLTRPVQALLYSPFSLAGRPIYTIQRSEAFDFDPIFPNSFLFSLQEEWPRQTYLKQVRCAGRVVTGKPLPIQPGEHVTCRLTLGTDPAAISGYVTEEGKSVKNMAVLLAPSSAVQREAHPYAGIGQIDGKGHYVIRGVAPGEYLLLIAPDDRTGSYLAPGFVRKHQFEARPIHVGPNQDLTVNLTLPTK
jgi:hypothetical protein